MAQQLVGTCPNGAEVDPTYTLTTIALDVAAAGLAAIGGLPEIVPWLLESPIIGQQATNSLCALNLQDPGDLTLSMLATPAGLDLLPAYDAPVGTLQRWIWDKTAYFFFQRACRCIGTGTKPPAPIVITIPPGADRSPSQPGNSDQLTRIENNLTSNDALKELYNGLQLVTTEARDLRFRMVESLVQRYGPGQFSMSGEGEHVLQPYQQVDGSQTQDAFGLLVQLTTIPATVARRGVVNQRLYGVGSVEWDCRDPASPLSHIIAQRDALHYDVQFVLAPQHVQSYKVRWRLQPGVTAFGYQVWRNSDSAIYAPTPPYGGAYQHFGGSPLPPSWSDPPIYPNPAALAAAAGRPLPP